MYDRIQFQFSGTGPNTAEMAEFNIQAISPYPTGQIMRVVAYLESAVDAEVRLMLTHTGSRKESQDSVPVYHHDPLWRLALVAGGVNPPDWYFPLPSTNNVAHRAVCRLDWSLSGPYAILSCAVDAQPLAEWHVVGVLVVDPGPVDC